MIGMVLAAGAGTSAASLHGHAPQGARPGRRRDDDPRHRAAQPGGRRPHRRDRRRRLPGRGGRARRARLEERHGVRLSLVHNDKAEEWNNCYSLWLAREHFAQGALLVNGDTVHPVDVERRLLAARRGRAAGILLALDDQKVLAEEEMKVTLDERRPDAAGSPS